MKGEGQISRVESHIVSAAPRVVQRRADPGGCGLPRSGLTWGGVLGRPIAAW